MILRGLKKPLKKTFMGLIKPPKSQRFNFEGLIKPLKNQKKKGVVK